MMKAGTMILVLLLPVAAMAQNYPGMGAADMQKMEHMEACMEKLDEAKLEAIERRSQQVEAEIKALCAGGKRAAAQQEALARAS